MTNEAKSEISTDGAISSALLKGLNPETATLEQCEAAIELIRASEYQEAKKIRLSGNMAEVVNEIPGSRTKSFNFLQDLMFSDPGYPKVRYHEYDFIEFDEIWAEPSILAEAINALAAGIDKEKGYRPLNIDSLVGKISEIQSGISRHSGKAVG